MKKKGLQVQLALLVAEVAADSQHCSDLAEATDHQHCIEKDHTGLDENVHGRMQVDTPAIPIDDLFPGKHRVQQSCRECRQRIDHDHHSVECILLAASWLGHWQLFQHAWHLDRNQVVATGHDPDCHRQRDRSKYSEEGAYPEEDRL